MNHLSLFGSPLTSASSSNCEVTESSAAVYTCVLKPALVAFVNPSFKAFDQHLNMVLSEVEETITTVDIDEETLEELVSVRGERACMRYQTQPMP